MRGRPPLREKRRYAYVGFRCAHELKAELVAAATKGERSMSMELQFRLDRSFRDDAVLEALARIEQKIGTGASLSLLGLPLSDRLIDKVWP